MAVYDDLTPYEYNKSLVGKRMLNIGWLGNERPFEKGKVDATTVTKLISLSEVRAMQMRGFHLCPFCPASESNGGHPTSEEMRRGSAELWVPGVAPIIYCAPTLVCHYIQGHEYLPPREFLDAVEAADKFICDVS